MKISSNLIILGVIAALIIGGAYAVTRALASPASQSATGTPGAGTSTAVGTGTGTAQAKPTPAPVNLVRVWNSMCVEGQPFVLLSVPLDAKFALVQPEAQIIGSTNGTVMPAGTTTAAPAAFPATPGFVGGTAAPTDTGTPQSSTTGSPQASSATSIVTVTGGNSSTKGTLGMVPAQNSCSATGNISGLQLVMCTGPQGSAYTLYVHDVNGTQTYRGILWDCSKAGHTPPASTNATAMPTLPGGTLPPTLPATLPATPPTLPPAPTSTP